MFSASGFNIVAGVAQPKAIIEVIEFNGDGTLSVGAVTLSVNGAMYGLVRRVWNVYSRGGLFGNNHI